MNKTIFTLFCFTFFITGSNAQFNKKSISVFETNAGESGLEIVIQFTEGKNFDDATFAFWIEDMEGNYIETLYVTQYLATGIYKHAQRAEGKPFSKPGFAKRPSSLPVWLHRRNDNSPLLPTPDKPVPDALTGATPKKSFLLNTTSVEELPEQFKIMFEINRPFDYNKHWTKTSYPGEFDYSYSAQPALLYSAKIDMTNKDRSVILKPIGHSHYSGKSSEIFTDLSSFTTALDMVKKIVVELKY